MSDSIDTNTEITFDDLALAEPIARAVKEKGYTKPSPIQAKAIPVVLQGGDLLASAQTGTGKTAAFTLPVLQKLLGDDYKVANFGSSGTLVQKVHPRGWKDGWFKPYWQTPQFEAFNRSSWDVVVIMIGTNDAKHEWFPRPCLREGAGPCPVATELTSMIKLARERGECILS